MLRVGRRKRGESKDGDVIETGGTHVLAQVTDVCGRWIEIKCFKGIEPKWALHFLQRSPWRANKSNKDMSNSYDVTLTIREFFVTGTKDIDDENRVIKAADGGFWVLADVIGSIKKKADLKGYYLTIAYLPSKGVPKLPRRVKNAPKNIEDTEDVNPYLPEETEEKIEDKSKRIKKDFAALHSGQTMF